MKRKFSIILLSFLCMTMTAQEAKTHLVVIAKDGTRVAYQLAHHPKLTFSATDLEIKTDLLEISYPLANMARFEYETENSATSLRDISTGEPICHFVGESLVFPHLEANNTVFIYTSVGQIVLSRTILSAGEYAFPLSNLGTGVYMVQVNGLTYKIVRK